MQDRFDAAARVPVESEVSVELIGRLAVASGSPARAHDALRRTDIGPTETGLTRSAQRSIIPEMDLDGLRAIASAGRLAGEVDRPPGP